MPSLPVTYRLDDLSTGRRILDTLCRRFPHSRSTGESRDTTYYDTFDWRVFRRGWVLTSERGHTSRVLCCLQRNGAELYRTPIAESPGFAWNLPEGVLRQALAGVLEMRRLLPLFTIEAGQETWSLLDQRRKTVARLRLERPRCHPAGGDRTSTDLPIALVALPVRGYDREFVVLLESLEDFDLEAADRVEFDLAAEAAGLEPGGYSRRLELNLTPDMRSEDALRVILTRLLEIMRQNERGLRENLDSEFLHDFRVSVRRTRAALGQLKGVLPPAAASHFSTEFSWLGQITGPSRDLDVYQLEMPAYRATLPEPLRSDLEPLSEFLERHRRLEHREMVQLMGTPRFGNLLTDWESFLARPFDTDAERPASEVPILELASERIWRAHQRVLKRGSAIGPETPPKALHRLRLHCKKLRYLLEFFRSLYPPEQMASLIGALKRLQDSLGDFNDQEVQQVRLVQFAQAMQVEGLGTASTLMAMGRLVATLERKQIEERRVLHKRFKQFSKPQNRRTFCELFGPTEMPQA